MKNFIIIVLVLVMFGGGYYVGSLDRSKPIATPAVITHTEHNPAIDSEFTPEIIYQDTGSTQYKDTGSYKIVIRNDTVKVKVPIDTIAIVKDYLQVRGYVFDTTFNNTQIIDSIDLYGNKIVLFNRTLIPLPIVNKFEIRAGLVTGVNDVTPMVTLGYKKMTYGIGYDLVGEEKGLRVNLMYKIK
jgi:hypothetical protein